MMMERMILPASNTDAIDPYFSNVVLLLQGRGANGSTTLADKSSNPKTVTFSGNAQISTAQSKFGNPSIYIPRDATSDVLIALASDAQFSTNDFTVEFFLRLTDNGSAYQRFLRLTSTNRELQVRESTLNKYELFAYVGATLYQSVSPLSMPYLTWVHHAVVRSGTTIKYYGNGSLMCTINLPAGTTLDYDSAYLNYGKSFSEGLSGYYDQVRITASVARYTANFTPPSTAFPTQ